MQVHWMQAVEHRSFSISSRKAAAREYRNQEFIAASYNSFVGVGFGLCFQLFLNIVVVRIGSLLVLCADYHELYSFAAGKFPVTKTRMNLAHAFPYASLNFMLCSVIEKRLYIVMSRVPGIIACFSFFFHALNCFTTWLCCLIFPIMGC